MRTKAKDQGNVPYLAALHINFVLLKEELTPELSVKLKKVVSSAVRRNLPDGPPLVVSDLKKVRERVYGIRLFHYGHNLTQKELVKYAFFFGKIVCHTEMEISKISAVGNLQITQEYPSGTLPG